MNHLLRRSGAAILMASLVLMLPMNANAGIKCWKNKEGVRECGNAIPPEYAQQGHEELSAQGVKMKSQERSLTREELEVIRAREEARKAREKAEQKRFKQQASYDRVLLATFANEEDLSLARDGKIAAIESRVVVTESRVVKLRENLKGLHAMAARNERAGKTISDKLLEDIQLVQRQIDKNLGYISDRREEQQALRTKFESDLARFRELKAGKPVGAL